MVYIKKSKFTLEEAAEILTNETNTPHSIKDVFQLAETNDIRIAIYKPKLIYSQKKAASNNQDLIHQAEYHTAYPLLSFINITKFVDSSTKKVVETLINIDAIDHDGNLFKVSSYTNDYQINVTQKDLFILDIDLKRYLSEFILAEASSLNKKTTFAPPNHKTNLMIQVIKSMKLNPLDLSIGNGEKRVIFNECVRQHPYYFSTSFESFSGTNGLFGRARKNGHIKTTQI